MAACKGAAISSTPARSKSISNGCNERPKAGGGGWGGRGKRAARQMRASLGARLGVGWQLAAGWACGWAWVATRCMWGACEVLGRNKLRWGVQCSAVQAGRAPLARISGCLAGAPPQSAEPMCVCV